MRTLFAAAVLLLAALACGGTDAGPAAPAATDPPGIHGEGFLANVHGVCRKYDACDCNVMGTVEACVTEFGVASEKFPPEVWGCMLARDCEGMCEFSAGACMLLYAEQVAAGIQPTTAAATCAPGQRSVEVYALTGERLDAVCLP